MNARIRDGWLEVDCDADHMAAVSIIVGPNGTPTPAFRGYTEDGKRTAKIRPPAGLTRPAQVTLIVDGHPAATGKVR